MLRLASLATDLPPGSDWSFVTGSVALLQSAIRALGESGGGQFFISFCYGFFSLNCHD